MRRAVLLTAVVSLTLVATAVGATITPAPVIDTRLDERNPAASADYLAWQQNSEARPRHYDVYVLPAGGESFKVNAAGTEGAMGGIDGTTLVYQEYQSKKIRSDLKLFDLASRTSSDLPNGVNTDEWEFWPSISRGMLLFGRHAIRSGNDSIILFDLSTGESLTLAESSGHSRSLSPGQVNGNFAVWDRTVFKHGALVSCEVFVYDMLAGTTTQVPNPRHLCQWGASVGPMGAVYYGRSGMGCGTWSKLMSYPYGGPPSVVVSLPRGTDFATSYALYESDGSTTVFFDPASCGDDEDIYKVNVPSGS